MAVIQLLENTKTYFLSLKKINNSQLEEQPQR